MFLSKERNSFCYVNLGYSPDCKYDPIDCPRRAHGFGCDCSTQISDTFPKIDTVNLSKNTVSKQCQMQSIFILSIADHYILFKEKG